MIALKIVRKRRKRKKTKKKRKTRKIRKRKKIKISRGDMIKRKDKNLIEVEVVIKGSQASAKVKGSPLT